MPETVKGMDGLQRRLKAIGETRPAMRALQLSTIHEAQARVHRQTGTLQRRIVPGRLTDDVAEVEARTPYAAAEEFGRKAITIVPKRRKVLAWGGERRLSGRLRTGSQATNFARKVNQPARKGHPYLVPGAKAALEKGGLIGEIVARWNKAD